MTRARKVCSHVGPEGSCPNLQPCPVPGHTPKPWASSRRRERTVSGWEQQRRAQRVMAAHDGICHVCGRPGATVCDHVISLAEGGADDVSNLAPIHEDCHRRKTEEEAKRARG